MGEAREQRGGIGVEDRAVDQRDVGAGEECVDLGERLGDHRTVAEVEVAEERPVLVAEVAQVGDPPAQRIARGRLHLHDVGARPAEQARAVAAGDPGREVDHLHVAEFAHHSP